MKKVLFLLLTLILLFSTVAFAKTISISSENININVSKTNDGYVTVNYNGPEEKVLFFTKFGEFFQNVDIMKGQDYIIPLPYGDGLYTFYYCEYNKEYKCIIIDEIDVKVEIEDEFKQYLSSNIWVDLDENTNSVKKSNELTVNLTSDFDKIKVIYEYIVENIEYDSDSGVPASGYSPNADRTLKKGKGVCSDFSGIMATMLRAQGIPTKIVTGSMASGNRHAWISVYSKDSGELADLFSITANEWSDIDPTNWLGYLEYIYSDDENVKSYVFDGGY